MMILQTQYIISNYIALSIVLDLWNGNYKLALNIENFIF